MNSITGLVGEKNSVLAAFETKGGFDFTLLRLEGKSGKPSWTADVWGAGRTLGIGLGYHNVDLRQNGDTVFVFGAECYGMYLEAFDIASGKCRFRFCTCYWFLFSEEWELK